MKKKILIPIVAALVCVDLMLLVISAGIDNVVEREKTAKNAVSSAAILSDELREAKVNEIAMRAANEDLQKQLEEAEQETQKTNALNPEHHTTNLLYTETNNAVLETLEMNSETQTEESDEVEVADTYKYIGEFKFTYYCSCSKCCGKSDGITASGTKATVGRTVAVDPDLIPYGSKIKVVFDDGTIAYYVAEDCGGSIKNKRIDIFVGSHQEALNLGINYGEVYIMEESV